jgi:1-acyl-sn-glycerol-3-phosphate acyltransferase
VPPDQQCGLGSRLFRLWRIPATGFAFASLGLGGLALAMLCFPLLRRFAPDELTGRRRTQRAISLAFQGYLFMLRLLGLITLRVEGRERIRACRGKLVVANHPTLLDVVLLMALVRNAQCVVKHQLWSNWFLGPVVRAAGYIRNDIEGEAFVAACRQAMAEGSNLIIFPEGTRSVPGQPLRLQRGFANVALLVPADLQLLRLHCEPITLVKGEPWWRVPKRRANFRVTVGELLPVAPFLACGPRAIGARRLTSHLQEYWGQARDD